MNFVIPSLTNTNPKVRGNLYSIRSNSCRLVYVPLVFIWKGHTFMYPQKLTNKENKIHPPPPPQKKETKTKQKRDRQTGTVDKI